MQDSQRIVGILVVSLAVFFLVVAGVGVLWWKNQGAAWLGESKLAFEEGRALGPTGDNSLCLDHSLVRTDECRGLGCEIGSIVFLNACLAKANPNPSFCDGVPSQTEVFESPGWRRDRCEATRYKGGSCENLFATVQGYCDGLRARGMLDGDDPAPAAG